METRIPRNIAYKGYRMDWIAHMNSYRLYHNGKDRCNTIAYIDFGDVADAKQWIDDEIAWRKSKNENR